MARFFAGKPDCDHRWRERKPAEPAQIEWGKASRAEKPAADGCQPRPGYLELFYHIVQLRSQAQKSNLQPSKPRARLSFCPVERGETSPIIIWASWKEEFTDPSLRSG